MSITSSHSTPCPPPPRATVLQPMHLEVARWFRCWRLPDWAQRSTPSVLLFSYCWIFKTFIISLKKNKYIWNGTYYLIWLRSKRTNYLIGTKTREKANKGYNALCWAIRTRNMYRTHIRISVYIIKLVDITYDILLTTASSSSWSSEEKHFCFIYCHRK